MTTTPDYKIGEAVEDGATSRYAIVIATHYDLAAEARFYWVRYYDNGEYNTLDEEEIVALESAP